MFLTIYQLELVVKLVVTFLSRFAKSRLEVNQYIHIYNTWIFHFMSSY